MRTPSFCHPEPFCVIPSVAEGSQKKAPPQTQITEVLLDDNGYCIHITFSGGVNASTLIAISEAFGDNDPNVYGNGENSIKIVFCNDKYDCLIDNE